MRFDKEHGEVVKGILREWIEGHSEGGVMSGEVKELWGKLCNSIDRKVMWYEGMPKEEGGVLDFKWFGDRVLSDWCVVCGEVDRLVMEIVGKVIDGNVDDGKVDTEEVFSTISVCKKCKYGEVFKNTGVWSVLGDGIVCKSPFGDMVPEFDRNGKCLVFEERE